MMNSNFQSIQGSNRSRRIQYPSIKFLNSTAGWLCWTVIVVLITLTISSVLHAIPMHFLNNRKKRALESARTLDRVHYDDFVNYVRMVDFCGSACYRTKEEAMRACWDKVRFCRVHFCRLEHEFGRVCKPIPGVWLPSPSPKPSVVPGTYSKSPALSMTEYANTFESPCKFSKTMSRVGKSLVFRVKCQCDDGYKQFFNASSDSNVGSCLHEKFSSMTTSLENACKARRNDSYEVYDWAFDTSCSMCSGHRPRPTRCNLNV